MFYQATRVGGLGSRLVEDRILIYQLDELDLSGNAH